LSEEPVAFEGDARAVEAWSAVYRSQLDHFARCIGRRSKRTTTQILEDLAAGRYLSPAEAVAYGLIDEIDGNHRGVRPIRPDAEVASLGYRPTGRASRGD